MIPHGTPSGYEYHGCLCDECRAAYRAWRRDLYARNAAKEGRKVRHKNTTPIEHGTQSGYDRRCRCVECKRFAPRPASSICGTTTSYRAGCHCQLCRDAYAAYKADYRDRKAREKGRTRRKWMKSEDVTHGTRAMYRRGCTCVLCVTAYREYDRRRNRRKREEKAAVATVMQQAAQRIASELEAIRAKYECKS